MSSVKYTVIVGGPECFFVQNRICGLKSVFLSPLQAKLAARRARRQEEARRQSEEAAAQRILEEQSQAIAANRPMDVDHVIVPDVIIPRETSEEEVRSSNSRRTTIEK